jgi:hypothetical protein
MLQLYLLPQLEDHQPNVVFHQDGATLIGLVLSENFLTCVLSAGLGVMDITPLDFFPCGCAKDTVYKTL